MSNYLLVGEMHGTKECPLIFLKIINTYKIKRVALELPQHYQHEIDQYVKGKITLDDLSLFKNKEQMHDGRVSHSIKKLIEKLKKQKIKIFFAEPSFAKNGNERDYLMAKNLMNIKGKVAFLCGNIHASKKEIRLDKKSNFYNYYNYYSKGIIKTCGYFLAKKDTISIRIHAINGGTFYNNGIKNYRKDEMTLKSKHKLPSIIKSSDKAFDYLYLINKFSYSK